MSFSSLPEELVDLVCLAVDPNSTSLLLNLSVVSKQTLLPAKRALYRSPFRHGHATITWSRALSLLDRLQTDDCWAGSLVRYTQGILTWTCDLYKLELDTQIGQFSSAHGWYCQILGTCQNLRDVDILFCSEPELRQALRSLAVSVPYLRNLCFWDYRPVLINRSVEMSGQEVINALRETSIGSLQTTDFSCLDLMEPTAATLVPQLPFSTKELFLSAISYDLRHAFPFLPSIDSGLENLCFRGNSTNDGLDLLALIQYLSPTLQSFAVCLSSNWDSPHIRTYGTLHTGPPLLLESIKALASLTITSLILMDFHGPSLRLLRQLVVSCPLLQDLSFYNSCWVSDDDSSSTIPEEVFPENEILDTLGGFENLHSIEFGWLPTEDVAKYGDLEETLMEVLGIYGQYQVCEAEEVNV